MRSRRLTISALALVALLVVAGCGGAAGEFNDSVGVAAPPGTEVLVVAPDAGAAAVPNTVVGGNPAAFCQDIEQLQRLVPALLQPADEAATLSQLQALLARTQADAPAAIRADVIVVRRTEDQLIKDLTANPPDLADISRTYRDPSYQQSLQQLGLYAVNSC